MNITDTGNEALDWEVIDFDARQGDRMLTSVHDFLGRFVVYPSSHAHIAHALWIVHTHLMKHWDSTPRIAFLSPEPGSGKSRALEVSELLVPNPVTSVNVTPAYLFRKVGTEEGATILFDEIDTVFGPKAKDNEDIRGLLNAGHRQGATAGRCVNIKGSEIKTEEIPAYAAVAMAGLGWLPDTIMTRAVIIRMRKRHPGEKVEPFRRRLVEPDGRRIYGLIEAWARTVTRFTWPELPAGIEDRDADVWEALITVADLIGGDWPVLVRDAAIAIVAESKNIENKSLGIRLLSDLMIVFGDDRLHMTTKEILAALQALDESPWKTINKGQPLDDRKLSSVLRQYEIKSENLVIGTTRPKGYHRAHLADAWLRYIPTPAKSAMTATPLQGPEDQAFQASAETAVAEASAIIPLALHQKPNETGPGAQVAAIADLQEGYPPKARPCQQCNSPTEPHERYRYKFPTGKGWSLIPLHAECIGFWKKAQEL